ncbi:MAG: carboxymuconolactone decarboxylase family protein [Dehalococcoidia bacterium]|nr:carboxymuconolactone decarboxylase family protein [Dehalococcoidia bacterium]
MSHDIELGALVLRDGLLLVVRQPAGSWGLLGGPLPPDADADEAMDDFLRACGVNAPAVEEDFIQTVYMQREGRHLVYNLYGPTEWTGEPTAPGDAELRWVSLPELPALPVEPQLLDAIYEVFGLKESAGEDAVLAAVASAVGNAMEEGAVNAAAGQPVPSTNGAAGAQPRFASRREAGLDVLGTLNATQGEKAARGMYDMFGTLTDDVLEYALGDVWADEAIDRRTKSLQVVAIVASQGHAGPLRSHINGALNHGATPEQIAQTMRLVAAYAGFPAALEAWRVMEKVFAGRGIKLGAKQ